MTPLQKLKRMEDAIDEIAKASKGMPVTDAFVICKLATGIAESAARIAGAAREAQGNRGAKMRLVRKVRAALGFMYP